LSRLDDYRSSDFWGI